MPSGIRNIIILLSILTLILIGVSIYVGLELRKQPSIDANPTSANNACGNNICDADESCDGIEQCVGSVDFVGGDCRNNCTYCGDNAVQSGEQCDDGNDSNDDECLNTCLWRTSNVDDEPTPTPSPTITPEPTPTPLPTFSANSCGNLSCDSGESCDGSNRCSGSGSFNPVTSCRLNCTYCGDGSIQSGEQCDDGNTNDGDSCSNSCVSRTPEAQGNGDTKVCGAACSSSADCPSDNTCQNGRCVLLACASSLGGLSPTIDQSNRSSTVCADDGCSLVQCGSACGPNRACPNGLSCNSNNQCVFTYCINNQCDNQCALPATDLSTDEMKIILQGLVVILLGLVAYQFVIVNNSFSLLGSLKQTFVKKDAEKTLKQRDRFESNF